MTISRDSNFIVSTSSDCAINVFDATIFELVCEFQEAHKSTFCAYFLIIIEIHVILATIRTAKMSEDSKFIVSGSVDGSIKIFDVQNELLYYSFEDAHSRDYSYLFL